MLSFSKRVDYGLAAVAYLARIDTPVNARKIAKFYSFPQRLTANVLKELTSKGVLKSLRGAYGGYYLAQGASKISVFEIITALEGPLSVADCTNHEHLCKVMNICPANQFMVYIHNHITQLLKKINLEDVAQAQFMGSDFFQLGELKR